MRDRGKQILKLLCLLLAALLVLEVSRVAKRANPLAHIRIPDLPSLPEESTNSDSATNQHPALAVKVPQTNHTGHAGATNPPDSKTNAAEAAATESETNSAEQPAATESNAVAVAMEQVEANSDAGNTAKSGTNEAPGLIAGEKPSVAESDEATHSSESNAETTATVPSTSESTNHSTNGPAKVVAPVESNAVPPKAMLVKGPVHSLPPGVHIAGMTIGPHGRASKRKPLPPLAPAIEARIDRITDSEILGPVIHPMPMALMGIAGDVAFLRAPNGQTGMVKAGDKLGEIKLLRIGINRVLVEEDGKEKELTIFSGVGGESLLSKKEETPDETTRK